MSDPQLLSVQILDALGVVTTHTLFIDAPSTVTIANLQTFANDYLPLLDGITSGMIVGVKVDVPLNVVAGLKSAPVAASEVERNGLFNFGLSGSKYKNGILVPSISESLLVNGKIDLTNAAITNWISFLHATTLGITIVSKFLVALQGLVDALLTFRKHRKAENRRSIES